MTRDEYMTALKNNIQSLTVDEQNEALQYYSDYFDDAQDDAKVMEELGSPEEVAKEALRLATHKLPVKCKIVSKADLEGGDSSEN